LLERLIQELPAFAEVNPGAAATLEWAYFQLGVGYIETQNFDGAINALGTYVSKYPDGRYRRYSLMLRADAYGAMENYDELVALATKIIRRERLKPLEKVYMYRLLGDALFRLERFKEAINPLHYVVRYSNDKDERANGATLAAISLIRIGDIRGLFKFMPIVYNTAAKYDVDLNLTLINEADNLYEEEKYEEAIILYRMVFFKQELIAALNRRTAETEFNIVKLVGTSANSSRASLIKRRLEINLKGYQAQLQKIFETEDYDVILLMRMATCYFSLERYFEALALYENIYQDYPKDPLAEQAQYSAFATALKMGEKELTYKTGLNYLEAFPQGQQYEELSVAILNMYLADENYQQVINMGEQILRSRPDHINKKDIDHMIGFSAFQDEQLNKAEFKFKDMMEAEGGDLQATYWYALTKLFQQSYSIALENFEQLTGQAKFGIYGMDAAYRAAICHYGMGDQETALILLEKHLKEYLSSPLASEIHGMIGDIYGATGDLDKAKDHFEKCIKTAPNQVQVNFGTFQLSTRLELMQEWDEIIKLFNRYLTKYGQKGNFTEAYYWKGTAYINKGDREQALETFFEAISKFGNHPQNYGIDMIMRDLIEEQKNTGDAVSKEISFLEKLFRVQKQAINRNQRTLQLRLATLFAEVRQDKEQREKFIYNLLYAKNIEHAGPITLDFMGREALKRGQKKLAREVFLYFLSEHPKSDLTLGAHRGLAEVYIAENNWPEAEKMLMEITERFSMQQDAGWAQTQLGETYRKQNKYVQAKAAYNSVLGVKEWRGEDWPKALYGLGLCSKELGNPTEACAYFERIYVMYDGYADWAAKAYLEKGNCLLDLKMRDKAIEVFREMTLHPTVSLEPETVIAKSKLKKLVGYVPAAEEKSPAENPTKAEVKEAVNENS